MFNLSKNSSLAIALALVGGLGLSNLASANTLNAMPQTQLQQLVVEGGSDRVQQSRVAENGSENLQHSRVALGGADHSRDLRQGDALVYQSNAARGSVIVAENRAEFGSKYQRY